MNRLLPPILMLALLAIAPATALASEAREAPEREDEVAYTAVMLVGDHTYEGVYVSTEVLAESVDDWAGLPVVPGHENAGKRRLEVGRVTDPRMEGDMLVATIRLDPSSRAYEKVDDYIETRFERDETPEVSVGMAARVDDDGRAKRLVADHLAIVKRGACGPIGAERSAQVAVGCGILPPGVEEGPAVNA